MITRIGATIGSSGEWAIPSVAVAVNRPTSAFVMYASSAQGRGGMSSTAIRCWRFAVRSITAPLTGYLNVINSVCKKRKNHRMLLIAECHMVSSIKSPRLTTEAQLTSVYYSFYTGSRKDGITMANVKTAISIQQSLFEQVEALARELHISRSRLFAIAMEDFMQRYENQRLLARINDAYADTTTPDEQALLRRMRRQQRQMVEGEW